MAMEKIAHITPEELEREGVVSAPTILTGTPRENKAIFDRLMANVLAPKVNVVIDIENQLIDADNHREENETGRVQAEEDRNTKERERQTAEQGRAAAETARGEAENQRVTAENKRADGETARILAEENREAKEGERQTAEGQRVVAENQRVTAEDMRVSAESDRQTAEQARVEAEEERKAAIGGLMEQAAQEARNAQAAAERAEAAAGDAVTAKDGAVGAAQSAGAASGEAKVAQGKAEMAATEAETAKDAAVVARDAAEAAKVEVETAKDDTVAAKGVAESAKTAVEATLEASRAEQEKLLALHRSYAMGTEDYRQLANLTGLIWGAEDNTAQGDSLGLEDGHRYIVDVDGVRYDGVARRLEPVEVAPLAGDEDLTPEIPPAPDDDNEQIDPGGPTVEIELVAGPLRILDVQGEVPHSLVTVTGLAPMSIVIYTDGHDNGKYYMGESKAARDAAEAAKDEAQKVQAALHSRRRVIFGTAADVERLMPGDTLIITDDSSVGHTTDYQDLLLEAQKAAAGETNTLETIAVLSVINATNLRRTADGLLWTTDTVADFRAKLTTFAAAAAAAGYVDAGGRCIAIWAQAQAWLITGQLITPLAAEAQDYPWRKAPPKTEYDAIKERLASIEAQLGQASDRTHTLIEGGNLT